MKCLVKNVSFLASCFLLLSSFFLENLIYCSGNRFVMGLSSLERFELKKFVKNLEFRRGSHTELVSVYVPAGYELSKIINHIQQEQGTATNIKSASTRKNVVDALERMIQHLRLYKGTPPNGLIAFSGNVAEREGQSDVQVWSIEPPVPINMRLYRCDKTFVLEPLQGMLDAHEEFGLVVMDRRDATIALLKGKSIVILSKTHSHVPGKFRTGGQSARRFERLRDIAAHEHYVKVGDYMKEQFLTRPNLKGIILGGPGPTKNDFFDGAYITADVKKKIIAVKDITYTDESGIHELLERSQDTLAEEEIADEKKIMNRFLEMLSKQSTHTSYGKDHVWKALEMGAVDTLLLSESLEDSEIEQFEEMAKKMGTTVKIISVETREGAQLRDIGKFGAILRYQIE